MNLQTPMNNNSRQAMHKGSKHQLLLFPKLPACTSELLHKVFVFVFFFLPAEHCQRQ